MSHKTNDPSIVPSEDISSVIENGTDMSILKLKKEEIEINKRIDIELSQDPNKIPRAIYYIVPNELAERFCYYGINPLLNGFFSTFLKLGTSRAGQLRHTVTMVAYATPLIGAALSDSLWGKYLTIILLSLVYVFGVVWTSIFSIPMDSFIGSPPALWGPLVGLFIMAIGTGGIKPCVSAHGGDQFLESQSTQLNAFYNYFYMAINAGSILGNSITPIIADMNCFGNEKDCYAGAFGLCAGVMIISLLLFWMGRHHYRTVPPIGRFVPLEILEINWHAFRKYWSASASEKKKSKSFLEFAKGFATPEMLDEVRDFNKVLLILVPTPFFWMAFDQSGSTWQNMYDRMNDQWFNVSAITVSSEHTMLLNPVMIVGLIPLFTNFIYPFIERFVKFRLLDRMLAGMGLAAIAFIITGLLQQAIDDNPSALIKNEEGILVCDRENNRASCVNGAWMILPYFIMTCGEILLSISGLNLTYQEVGKKTKASASSVWLFMVSIGSLLDVALYELDEKIGHKNFLYLNAGIIGAAILVFGFIRQVYVYRNDRNPIIERTPVQFVSDEKKSYSSDSIQVPEPAIS